VRRTPHNASARKAGGRPRRPAGRQAGRSIGFTLIELLTILVILGLLIAIASPAVLEARRQFKIQQTLGRLGQIDKACYAYYTDWDEKYPPSEKAGVLFGKQRLVQALTGYAPVDVDGKDGYGARKVPRGRVYGPYLGTERLPQTKAPKGTTPGPGTHYPTFLDAFGNQIYYYRHETGSNPPYVQSHNDANAPPQLTRYLKDPNDNYFRADFVLLTPGPNAKWDTDPNSETDDMANFKFRRLRREDD